MDGMSPEHNIFGLSELNSKKTITHEDVVATAVGELGECLLVDKFSLVARTSLPTVMLVSINWQYRQIVDTSTEQKQNTF